jgi:hypothetical protein
VRRQMLRRPRRMLRLQCRAKRILLLRCRKVQQLRLHLNSNFRADSRPAKARRRTQRSTASAPDPHACFDVERMSRSFQRSSLAMPRRAVESLGIGECSCETRRCGAPASKDPGADACLRTRTDPEPVLWAPLSATSASAKRRARAIAFLSSPASERTSAWPRTRARGLPSGGASLRGNPVVRQRDPRGGCFHANGIVRPSSR